MKYGFVIDNRKCIGCHACTTACKSEHDVAVGVNRTWVKQVEKGEFPDTRRLFSVMRCNHCTDAPCASICPTEALFTREDGIVDFDNDRCIGCKSCMQACPYDALYIDPDTSTAAKCNYCAHRVDVGLEPACVNVCPEHAIISGDMHNPETEISQLLARQPVKVRKPEKATEPNLFYIDADDASLVPTETEKSDDYFWSSQSHGVGHYAKEAEKLVGSNKTVIKEMQKVREEEGRPVKSVDVLMNKASRAYDAPDKGILWGWEVSAYVWTKAIAAGLFLVPFLAWAFGLAPVNWKIFWISNVGGLLFLGLTGLLLIKDLDRPDRFLYVLLRPHWESWLVKGGYAISIFGALLTAMMVIKFLGLPGLIAPLSWITAVVGVVVAVYTAFLFAQAKGRDFWQSPTLAIHMLVHSVMAGAAVFLILALIVPFAPEGFVLFAKNVLMISIGVNMLTMLFELTMTHPTKDAKTTVNMITKGRYSRNFWMWVVLFGNIIPFAMIAFVANAESALLPAIVSAFVLIGIYVTEHIWVEAPQRIPLS
ncbi:MAG: polysulfide reductase NrfD [Bacteroidia bacterium]|nr:polysulfide reductase NrfD [Bacteroidia bacterium]